MKKTHLLHVYILLACILSILIAPNTSVSAQTVSTEGIDIVVVLDDSGSMRTDRVTGPGSDDLNLRYSAAKLLLNLIDNDDRIAFVRFDSKAESIGRNGFIQAGSQGQRTELLSALVAPDDYTKRGWTRIDLGFDQAVSLLTGRNRSDQSRPAYILLLTDGKPTGATENEQNSLITNLKKKLTDSGLGYDVFPMRLCAKDGDCDATFLTRAFGYADVVNSAEQLLEKFASIYQQMKPGIQVVPTSKDGEIRVRVRAEHGVTWIKVVSPRTAAKLIGSTKIAPNATSIPIDGNVRLDAFNFAQPEESIDTWSTPGSFAVIRTRTDVKLIHPPSANDTPVGIVRYVAKGSSVINMLQITEPGGNEPVKTSNSNVTLERFQLPNQRFYESSAGTRDIEIQVGDDDEPLQITRKFRFQEIDGAPGMTINSIECGTSNKCVITAQFTSSDNIDAPSATAYIRISPTEWLDPISLSCSGIKCTGEFLSSEGINYDVFVLGRARWRETNQWFGNSARKSQQTSASLTIKNLPAPLVVQPQAENSWNIQITSTAAESLGQLKASVLLSDDKGTPFTNQLQAQVNVQITQAGTYEAALTILGADKLPVGSYTGKLRWEVNNLPINFKMPSDSDITIQVDAPKANINMSELVINVDSPQVIDTVIDVPVRYVSLAGNDEYLTLRATSVTNMSCSEAKIDVTVLDQTSTNIVLNIKSSRELQNLENCNGEVFFTTTNTNASISPDRLPWKITFIPPDWEFHGSYENGAFTAERLILSNYADASAPTNFLLWPDKYVGQLVVRLNKYNPDRFEGELKIEGFDTSGVSLSLPQSSPLGEDIRVMTVTLPVSSIPFSTTSFSGELIATVDGIKTFEKPIKITIKQQSVWGSIWSRYHWWIVGFILLWIVSWVRDRMNDSYDDDIRPPPPPIDASAGPDPFGDSGTSNSFVSSDPFGASDPFTSSNSLGASDPFGSSDPFGDTSTKNGSDP